MATKTTMRGWAQTLLKVVNCVMGMVGIAMVLYGFWMVHLWQRDHVGEETTVFSASTWLIYAFLGLGLLMCFVTGIGHIAAASANDYCLSCYMNIVFLLLVLETVVASEIFMNSNWEKDVPRDSTGTLTDIEGFVKENFDFCKWVGSLIALAQGLSFFFSMVLRSLGREEMSEDDDDLPAHAKLPLVLSHLPPRPLDMLLQMIHIASMK